MSYNQPIPRLFHDYATGAPFTKCQVCERDLLSYAKPYLIEKTIRRYPSFNTEDVIFEFALCMDCAEQQRNQMSKESRVRLEAYWEANFNSMDTFELDASMPAEYYLDKCAITGERRLQMEEYQIAATCQGSSLLPGIPPFLMGGGAMETVMELMSSETIDQWNRFRDDHLGPSPEVRDLLKGKPVLL